MNDVKIFSSGFVSLIGRPNVGKSTLMNAFLGEKLSITSNKPQTTRNMIKGILTESDSQIVFLDTPGIHDAKAVFNKKIVDEALVALEHIDLILFLTEPNFSKSGKPFVTQEDAYILERLKKSNVTKMLIVNKIDMVDKVQLLPFIDLYKSECDFEDIFMVSALENDGVDNLLGSIRKSLPDSVKYFDEDYITDRPERFLAAEIIREKVFKMTSKEVPYSTAVMVETFKEKPKQNLVVIDATIIIEKDSQKGIIIGKGGKMLKKIGAESRRGIEELLNIRVFLKLFVKVSKNWTKSEVKLKEFGY